MASENKYSNNVYVKTRINMLLTTIALFGAVNWGLVAFDINIVKILSNKLNVITKSKYPFDKIIYLLVTACAVAIAMKRETWLPFLGKTVLPDAFFQLSVPQVTDKVVKINTLPNAKIIYWASLPHNGQTELPHDELPDVVTAYGNYSNSGVVMSDANGIALLPVLTGTDYIVPSGRIIKRHVHYRIVGLPNGMIGKIYSVKY